MRSEIRPVALLVTAFFALTVHASGQNQNSGTTDQIPKTLEQSPVPIVTAPIVTAPAAANPTATASNKPALVNTDRPVSHNPSGTVTALPASKRLAISILAGVLTLIAALWIGARRD